MRVERQQGKQERRREEGGGGGGKAWGVQTNIPEPFKPRVRAWGRTTDSRVHTIYYSGLYTIDGESEEKGFHNTAKRQNPGLPTEKEKGSED